METIDFETLADAAYDRIEVGTMFIGAREVRLIERLTDLAIPQAQLCFALETESLSAEHLLETDDAHDQYYCQECGSRGELVYRAKARLARINLAGNGATFSYQEPWTEGERFSFSISTADLTDPIFPNRLRERIAAAQAARKAQKAATAARKAQEEAERSIDAEEHERAEYERLNAKYGGRQS